MEIDFDEVRKLWREAGGKDTGGILEWFAPPVTTTWRKETIKTADVGALNCIGGYNKRPLGRTCRVEEIAGGTKAVGDFVWNPTWGIVAVRDPETGQSVILDGNNRTVQLFLAWKNERVRIDQEVSFIVGDLNLRVVRIVKAVAPLYRECA